MASGQLAIKIKIDQDGNVKNLISDFKDLRSVLKDSDIFKGFKSIAEGISQSLDDIKVDIREITQSVEQSIRSISSQSQELSDNALGRSADQAIDGVEKLSARTVLLTATAAALGANVDRFLGIAISGFSSLSPLVQSINTALTGAGQIISGTILVNLNLLIDGMTQVGSVFAGVTSGVLDIATFFTGFASITAGLVGSLTTFSVTKFFLSEIDILLGRILGRGQENLNVLTRATNLIALFDDGLNRSFKVLGSITRLSFFTGISAFVNPILGIPGVLNSSIDLLTNFFRLRATRIAALFGDGRAQTTLILDNLRDIGRKVLPTILKIADSFKFTLENLNQTQLDGIVSKLFGVEKRTRSIFTRLKEDPTATIQSGIKSIVAQLTKAGGIVKGIFSGLSGAVKGIFSGFSSAIKGVSGIAKSIFSHRTEKPIDEKPIESASKATEQLSSSAQKAGEKFATTRGQVKLILDLLFEVEKQAKKTKDGLFFGAGQAIGITNFIGALVGLSEGTRSFDSLNKSAKTFVKTLEQIALSSKNQPKGFSEFITKLGTDIEKGLLKAPKDLGKFRDELQRALLALGKDPNLSGEAAQKLGSDFTKALTGAIKQGINISQFREASKSIVSAIGELIPGKDTITKKINLGKAGEEIPKQIVEGIGKSKGTFEKGVAAMVVEGTDQLPQSPAKKGPLKNLVRSGSQIPKQLASGMQKNISAVGSSANKLAEMIANYFPRSLPRLGPLRLLVKAGVSIPKLLASGITKGSVFAINAIEKLTGDISERINKIAELSEIADRANISTELIAPLQNVLQQFGANASEITLPFNKINEAIQGSNEDAAKKLREIGIDLDALKGKVDAPLNVFLRVSDIIKNTQQGSEEAKKALEALGISASSGLVKVLRQGSFEIEGLLTEASNLGITFDEAFAKSAVSLRALRVTFEGFINSGINRILEGFLPQLTELGAELSVFFQERGQQIQSLILTVSNVINASLSLVISFVKLAFREPQKALDIAGNSIRSFVDLVLGLFNVATSGITSEVTKFFNDTGSFIFLFTKNLVTDVFVTGGNLALIKLSEVFFKVVDFLDKATEGLIPKIFSKIGAIVVVESSRLVTKVVQAIVDSTKKIPGLDFILKKAGIDIDSISETLKEVEFAVDNSTGNFSKKVKVFLSEITGDSEKATKRFEESISNIFAKTGEQLKSLKESAKEATESLEDKGILSRANEEISKFKENISGALEGTELEGKLQDLVDSFKIDNVESIDVAREKIVALGQDVKKAVDDGKENVSVFGEIANDFVNANAKMSKGILSGISGQLNELFLLGKKRIKGLFVASKAAAIAEATINIARAISNSIGAKGFFGIAEGALAASAATIQLAKIVGTTLGFRDGGQIQEGTGPKADDVLVRVSKGEFIQPADATQFYGPEFMELLRKRAIPRDAIRNLSGSLPSVTPRSAPTSKFQAGGLTSSAVGASQKQETVVANFVDPELFGRFMSTQQGKRIIFNVMRDNPGEFRSILSQD